MTDPTYDLFAVICRELSIRPSAILPEDTLGAELVEDLKERFGETDGGVAVARGVGAMRQHLLMRGSDLPFTFDKPTREFNVIDQSYVNFIAASVGRRGAGRNSVEFEKDITRRLCTRLTGALHRVGTRRTRCRRRVEYLKYLMKLGFDKNALGAHDQDGGFDILWLPPLGAIPLRPIVSIQCKNAFFDEDEANRSVGRASTTLRCRSHIRDQQLHFVVFNDFIDDEYKKQARGWGFVALGLSDLGALRTPFEMHIL